MGLKVIPWDALGERNISKWLSDINSSPTDAQKYALSALRAELTPWKAFEPYYMGGADLRKLVKREAAHLIIPFLIDLLRQRTMENKDSVLAILENLATFTQHENRLVEDHLPQEALDEYRFYANRLFNKVYSGLDTYNALLDDERREVREAVQSLLESLS